jgi:DNA (cytosine-5)-methyltransferase 1
VTVLYNEIEPYAAAWLRNLSAAGHIARGSVDARSIRELRADGLVDVAQFHTFAGLGAWSYALRLAGWPDDRPVWTGSCPCQPFSVAGRGDGTSDERHLWPEWFRLIRECRPPVIFGEQVASPDGLAWLDAVCADLEGAGYAVGAADLCAAGVGAPHIRQQLYFGAVLVADAERWSAERHRHPMGGATRGDQGREEERQWVWADAGYGGATRSMADPHDPRLEGRKGGRHGADQCASRQGGVADAWGDVEWLACRDGKMRPTQPGLLPLVDGAPARVGRLRAFGNAIVPQVAATFVRAFMETLT